MTAYIAFLIDIHDQAAFTGYAQAAAPTYPIYGGGVALRGPIVEVLEGALDVSHDTRLVVLQFPSSGQARAWWDSEQYRPLVKPPAHRTRTWAASQARVTAPGPGPMAGAAQRAVRSVPGIAAGQLARMERTAGFSRSAGRVKAAG